MLGRCSRLAAHHARTLGRLQVSIAASPRSLLDLLSESTSIAPAIKDEVVAPVELATRTDHIQTAILRAGSLKNLLELIERHGIVMSGGNLVECWKRIDVTVSFGCELEELRKEPGFQALIESTCERLRVMDPMYFVHLSRVLVRLEFTADSKIVERFCQSTKYRFKYLTLDHIVMIQLNIAKIRGSALHMDVLRLSAPVVFQTRMRSELQLKNPASVRRALMFVLTAELDPETVEYVAKAALQHRAHYSIAGAYDIVVRASANKAPLGASIRETLRMCLDVLANNPSELTENHIAVVLDCCEKQELGSRTLFEAFWSDLASWSSEMTISLLRASSGINYMPLPAAELAVDLILDNKDQVIDCIDILRLVEAVVLVTLEHAPDSEKYRRALLAGCILAGVQSKIDEIVVKRPHQLAELLLYFAAVGLFPEERLGQLFDEAFQRSLCDYPLSCHCVLELEKYLSLSLGESNPFKAIPEVKTVKAEDAARSPTAVSLLGTLQVALGGEKFVAENVDTPSGTRADYVIAMRRGEYAIAFSSEQSKTLDKIPLESKVVAILLDENRNVDSTNFGLKKLLLSLRERHLRAQNICTLVINMQHFESLRRHERTPFVMKKIKEVIRDGPVYNGNDESSWSDGVFR